MNKNFTIGETVLVRMQGFNNEKFIENKIEDIRFINGTLSAVFKFGYISIGGDGLRKIKNDVN